jgi:hypothetical protein
MLDPSAPFSKLKERRSRKKCPDKQISAQDLWPNIRVHGFRLLIRLYGIKLQGTRLLNIKPHGIKSQSIMPHSARLPSIRASAKICSSQSKWQIQTNKFKHFKKPQKVEDDQYCKKLHIWM